MFSVRYGRRILKVGPKEKRRSSIDANNANKVRNTRRHCNRNDDEWRWRWRWRWRCRERERANKDPNSTPSINVGEVGLHRWGTPGRKAPNATVELQSTPKCEIRSRTRMPREQTRCIDFFFPPTASLSAGPDGTLGKTRFASREYVTWDRWP